MDRTWRNRRGSSGRLVFYAIALLGIAGVVGYFVWFTPCNSVKQAAAMSRAQAYIEAHQAAFFKEWKFGAILWQPHTGGRCGCLLVSGLVLEEADADAVKATIAATSPDVEVIYQLETADKRTWVESVPPERREEFGLPLKKDGSPGPLGDPATW
ncbi:MAG: hypothetical protein IT434_14070 [Phycisphaerales bacterium]|jgi:hypothetical protein|nr:hypothetical protein [Phycisphaerales bacterium]